MNQGKLVFAQIMEHLPLSTFRRCVAHYDGEHKVKRFSCLDQYLCMAFAQLTWRESLRDIEACLPAHKTKLYHLGIRGNVARNTLANANAMRDWRIYCDFAQRLIGIARRLYAEEPLGKELKDTVYGDFERLARLNDVGSFVTRAKSNFRAHRHYSHAVDRATGLVCDQTVVQRSAFLTCCRT